MADVFDPSCDSRIQTQSRCSRTRTEVVQPKSLRFTIITNSPYASRVRVEKEIGASHQVVRLPSELDPSATALKIRRQIEVVDYDAILVDTFPRGLAGELAEVLPNMNCKKVLIHRDLNPSYAAKYQLAKFVKHYDLIISPGEKGCLSNSSNAITTSPWFNRDSDELLQPPEAKQLLGVKSQDRQVIAIVGCGRDEEAQKMRSLANRLAISLVNRAEVLFISPIEQTHAEGPLQSETTVRTVSLWPFFEAIRGVDLLVGGGGYNTVNEARAAGVEYIGVPWERLYDRQVKRLRESELALNVEEANKIVLNKVATRTTQRLRTPQFSNGVHRALFQLKKLVGKGDYKDT